MAASFTFTRLLVLFLLSRCGLCVVSSIGRQVALRRATAPPDTRLCRSAPGLSRRQLELCHRQPDAVVAALQGLAMAVRECQHQLQGHRWNCSALVHRQKNPHTSPIFRQGFKESAFAHALTAAGVVVSVSRACVQGALVNCGCDPRRYRHKGAARGTAAGTKGDGSPWKWGGCSHNVRFGVRFSKRFLNAREKGGTMLAKINMHNDKVGRMAVANNMQVKCKCHGVSGSCEMKTCWRIVPDFRLVGKLLRDNYRSAILVDRTNLSGRNLSKSNVVDNGEQRQKERRRGRRRKDWTPRKGAHTRRDLSHALLYYRTSPDFCERDARLEVPGTGGRACDAGLAGAAAGGCGLLCCGRGHDLLRRRRLEQCNCQFRWCCQVECQTCVLEEWISVCK